MTTTTKPPKAVRAVAIATCIRMACDHFKADPHAVYSHIQLKCPNARKARAAVWVHMHACGKSYEEIGRIFKRGTDCVRGSVSDKFSFTPDDWAMIEGMPKIWVSSLEGKS